MTPRVHLNVRRILLPHEASYLSSKPISNLKSLTLAPGAHPPQTQVLRITNYIAASSAGLDSPAPAFRCKCALDPPLSAKSSPFTKELDLQFQLNLIFFLDSLLDQLDQGANVFGFRRSMIDEEVPMQRADLSIANAGAS